MDERDRETFKGQFIKLTFLLNVIVLFVAIGAFVLIRFNSLPGIAVGLALLVAGVITFAYFSRLYHETREWLEIHAEKGEKAETGEKH